MPGILRDLLSKATVRGSDTIVPFADAGSSVTWWNRLVESEEAKKLRAIGDGTNNSAVEGCLAVLEAGFSEPKLTVFRRTASGDDPLPGHRATRVLNRPNKVLTGKLVWKYSIRSMHVEGNTYLAKFRNRQLDVVELWPLNPTLVKPVGNADEFITHYEYRPRGRDWEVVEMRPQDVIHLRLKINSNDFRLGVSALKPVLRSVLSDDEADKYTSALLANLGVPGIVITPKTDEQQLTAASREAIKQSFTDKFSGEGRGTPLVLGSKLDVQVLSFSPDQLNLSSVRRIPEERISGALGVPALLAGLGAGLERATYSNADALISFFTRQKLVPDWGLIGEELDNSLRDDFALGDDEYIGYDLSTVQVLQADQNELVSRMNTGVGGGWIRVSEARQAARLEVGPQDNVYLRAAATVAVPADAPPPLDALPAGDEQRALGPGSDVVDGEVLSEELKGREAKAGDSRPFQAGDYFPGELEFERQLSEQFRLLGEVFPAEELAREVVTQVPKARRAVKTVESEGGFLLGQIESRIAAWQTSPDGVEWSTEFRNMIRANYKRAFARGGQRAFDALGIVDARFVLTNEDMIRRLNAASALRSDGMDRVTREQLAQAVLVGLARGVKAPGSGLVAPVVAALRARIATMATRRSALIARADTGDAFSLGGYEAYRRNGIRYKRWLTSEDDRVTEGCRENERAGSIPIEEAFPSGHIHPVRFPGCRCELAPDVPEDWCYIQPTPVSREVKAAKGMTEYQEALNLFGPTESINPADLDEFLEGHTVDKFGEGQFAAMEQAHLKALALVHQKKIDAPVLDVSLDAELYGTSKHAISKTSIQQYISGALNKGPIRIAKYGNKFYIVDGHARVIAGRVKGDSMISAQYLDLDALDGVNYKIVGTDGLGQALKAAVDSAPTGKHPTAAAKPDYKLIYNTSKGLGNDLPVTKFFQGVMADKFGVGTFADMEKFHLDAINRTHQKKISPPVVDFDLNAPLIAHQDHLEANYVEKYLPGNTKGPVRIAKYKDLHYVIDGHHRIAAGRINGDTAIQAQFLDLDALTNVHGAGGLDLNKATPQQLEGLLKAAAGNAPTPGAPTPPIPPPPPPRDRQARKCNPVWSGGKLPNPVEPMAGLEEQDDSPFPADVEGLVMVKRLGGSTGAELVKDPATGRQYVRKRGANAGHLREEVMADELYASLGVKVARARLYETSGGPVKLAEYIQGRTLQDVMNSGNKKLIDEVLGDLRKNYVVDALLGNWDVVGMNADNILVDGLNRAIRIDNGGSLRYRAQGQKKAKFSDHVTELWSLRDAQVNAQTAQAFRGMTLDDIITQIRGIDPDWLKAQEGKIPREVHEALGRRMESLFDVINVSNTFRGDAWKDTYTDEFLRHLIQIRDAGIADRFPKTLTNEGPPNSYDSTSLKDENGKPFDTLRGDSGLARKDFADYITARGGQPVAISSIFGAQAADSWQGTAKALKWFMSEQRNVPDSAFWWKSSRNSAKAQFASLARIASGSTESVGRTLTAWHAFQYEFLRRTDFRHNDRARGMVQLLRTENEVVMRMNRLARGAKGVTMTRGAAESTSIFRPVSIFGSEMTIQWVPHHRVFGMYLFSRPAGYGSDALLAGNGENEFVAMLEGIPFDYVSADDRDKVKP